MRATGAHAHLQTLCNSCVPLQLSLLTCFLVTFTGAVDDIRRATDLALRSVSEFGLSAAVGPLNVGVLAGGGSDDGAWLMRDNGNMAQTVEAEVSVGCQQAAAGADISVHPGCHQGAG